MRIDIRVSPEIKEEWQKRADSKGLTLTRLILDAMDGVHTDTVHTDESGSKDVHTKEEDVHTGDEGLEELVRSGKVFRGSMFKSEKLNRVVDTGESGTILGGKKQGVDKSSRSGGSVNSKGG